MSSRRPRRRPGQNRELLIEAGLVEFGLYGYHGASTSAIAVRADVPQPHVYANFATKQELFLECFLRASTLIFSSPDEVCPNHSAFIFQAVSVVNDPTLSQSLPLRLATFREELGDIRFYDLLADGALTLVNAAPLRGLKH